MPSRALHLSCTAFAAVLGLSAAPAWSADVLDCNAAMEIASNPHNVGRVGMSGSGWTYSKAEPRLVDANGNVKREGNADELTAEVEPGDRIEATIKLLDARAERRAGVAPKGSYRFRWIAPREVKLSESRRSRCSDEETDTLTAGMQSRHTTAIRETGLEDIRGEWKFIAYDVKARPLALFSYDLSYPKTKHEKDVEFLVRNFRDYMDLGKCLSLNLTPLSKNDYLQAITVIDRASKAKGLDTSAIWEKTGAEHKPALDTWDRHIAGYTGLSWEQRKMLREVCASTSALLMQAAKDASGGGAAPKKDF